MIFEEQLNEEIADELKLLKNASMGTDEYKTAVDGVSKLMDRAIELKKIESDMCNKIDSQDEERKIKIAQLNEEKKSRQIQNLISIAGIVVPTVLTIWGTVTSFKFERDGNITTIMGRGFIQKMIPKK